VTIRSPDSGVTNRTGHNSLESSDSGDHGNLISIGKVFLNMLRMDNWLSEGTPEKGPMLENTLRLGLIILVSLGVKYAKRNHAVCNGEFHLVQHQSPAAYLHHSNATKLLPPHNAFK
jgi:hypothetical protein